MTKKKNPKVSIIMPVYNAERFIAETLDCILSQTHKNVEVICVLDCPPDNSEKVIKSFQKKDKRIIIVKQPTNMGPSAARNAGVMVATGDYLHFIDSDDLMNAEFYSEMLKAIKDTNSEVASSCVYYEKKPSRGIKYRKQTTASGKRAIRRTQVLDKGWSWRYVIDKDFWDNNGLFFPEDIWIWEDKPVMTEMVYLANSVVFCPSATLFYKNRPTSILNIKKSKERLKRDSEQRGKSRALTRAFLRSIRYKRFWLF